MLRDRELIIVLLFAAWLTQPSIGGAAPGSISRISADYAGDGPNGIRGGRFSAVVIDPTNELNAYATSETGGVYVSHDFGFTWATTYASDGTNNSVGIGFSSGVHAFNDLAISPDGATLLLIVDDDGTVANSAAGIWRSTDFGQTWLQPSTGNPTVLPTSNCNRLGGVGKTLFSPTNEHKGFVYATGVQPRGLGRRRSNLDLDESRRRTGPASDRSGRVQRRIRLNHA